ncbi:MAG: restriction endonuclease [Anaerolineae bacterium]|nr:restriction endonuclease [Anaerolineae bacterium]
MGKTVEHNMLYYGDNLDVLRRHCSDQSVDLLYLDPPFNSNATYNVLFAEQNGSRAAAQIKAFEDTWRWDQAAAETYQQVVEAGGKVSQAMQAFRMFLGDSNMLAYLAMMAPRLVELRRVLKPTGSIYLHCDPTASHYLKMLMDAVFGPVSFRSEIVWKRTSARSDSHRWNHIHDIILFYTRGSEYTWHTQHTAYDGAYTDKFYRFVEPSTGRRYCSDNLTASGTREGSSGRTWHDIDVRSKGLHWKYTIERLDELDKAGRILWPKKTGGVPRYKRYLDEMPGLAIQSIVTDIPPLAAQAAEKLGYPTQKPEALLERIIKASSSEGDLVLDPFCGCGTTIAAAQKLNRPWIGIDITHLAITLIKHRLKDTFGDQVTYKVIGEPVSLPDARTLAEQDPYQFQWWALGLVGARPVGQKKGSDKGIDGRLYFHDEAEGGKTKQVVLSVKAGHTSVAHVRDLRGVMEREQAAIGVLLTMQEPTQSMRAEAAGTGFYDSPGWETRHPRVQILTVAQLLSGDGIDMPPIGQVSVTFKKAPKAKGAMVQQLPMDD